MRILDVFSWLPAKEINIVETEKIFCEKQKVLLTICTKSFMRFQMTQMQCPMLN